MFALPTFLNATPGLLESQVTWLTPASSLPSTTTALVGFSSDIFGAIVMRGEDPAGSGTKARTYCSQAWATQGNPGHHEAAEAP